MKYLGIFVLSAFFFQAPASFAEGGPKILDTYKWANMEVVYASGFYDAYRNAVLALSYADGEKEPSSIVLTVKGRKLEARIWNTRLSRCGNRYYARLYIPDFHTATDLLLVDYGEMRCRLYVRDVWHATVSTREADGSESTMELVGNPGS